MYTRCPNCLTVFHLSAAHLARANGKVRCGRCNTVYNALAHLYDEPPETWDRTAAVSTERRPVAAAPVAPTPVTAITANAEIADAANPDPGVPVRQEPRLADMDIDETDWEPGPAVGADDEIDADTIGRPPAEAVAESNNPEAGERETAPVEAEAIPASVTGRGVDAELPPFLDPAVLAAVSAGPSTARSTHWSWPILGLLLAVLLPAQHFYFKRDLYAGDQNLRPWLERLCTLTGCDLPLRRDPAQIDIVNRKVVSHPGVRNALLINATFVNHAVFVQPYPVLELLLTDSTGAPVAMRRFLPVEYLSDGVDIAAGMAPEVPVHLLVEVAEPSKTATSFQFEFL